MGMKVSSEKSCDIKEYIKTQVEKFVKEHAHSDKFYETISDTISNAYYMECMKCGDVTYIDVINHEENGEIFAEVLDEIEKEHHVTFCNQKV